MAAVIIDGNAVAAKITEQVKSAAAELAAQGRAPLLVALQVGENPASAVYVKNQKKSCEEASLAYRLDQLPETATQAEVEAHLAKLNADPHVTGIILQMPLPPQCDARKVQLAISPAYRKSSQGLDA